MIVILGWEEGRSLLTIFCLAIAISVSRDLCGDRLNNLSVKEFAVGDQLDKCRNNYGNKPKRIHSFQAAT